MPTPKPATYCIDCGGPCGMNHITGLPRVHVTSPSRIFNGNVVGKRLTNRRIEHYRVEGYYGGTMLLPTTGPRCCQCQGTKNVKRREYNYLPKDGFYCEVCIDQHRASRDKQKELSARIRRAMKEDYI